MRSEAEQLKKNARSLKEAEGEGLGSATNMPSACGSSSWVNGYLICKQVLLRNGQRQG